MDDDEKIDMHLHHKTKDITAVFSGKAYSSIVGKAFSFMMKNLNEG